ncbi:Glutathione Hydrolase 3 Proenzyme-Like, partial [Manis pentadactyla]
MHRIRLRRELGFNSDLSARGECAIQFQDYSEAIVVSMVILEFRHRSTLGVKMCLLVGINVEVKESSPGLGPMVRHRFLLYVIETMRLLFQYYSDAMLISKGECEVESWVEGVIGDINDEGEISGPWIGSRTLKLMATFRDISITWKELGSGSDVTGVQDVEQVYGEACLTSMFQGDGQIELHVYVYGMTDIEADGALLSDINADAEDQQGILFKGKVFNKGDGQTERQVYFAARQTLKLMATFRDISITRELGSGSDVTGSARCWKRFM